jgi:tRNA threonylcarbamoyladenosine biosynthesis protein TsaB
MSTNPPTARRWLLAIDASTEQASLALFDGVQTAESTWPAGRNQTSAILGEIAHLGELAGCNVREELGCVAVATGPGMFNGLRVAMSIAKGFALASGAALIGAPTLQIAAEPFSGPVVAVAAAGRARLLWQSFRDGQPTSEAVNGQFVQLLAELTSMVEPTAVTGELSSEQWRALAGLAQLRLAMPPAHTRRAGALAAIAWRHWQAGDVDEPAALEPIYLHANPAPV